MRVLDDYDEFDDMVEDLRLMFLNSAKVVDVGEWHSQPIDNPLLITRELQDAILVIPVPTNQPMLERRVRPNMPWAEDHFQERVSGRPLNPPPSNEWWPFAQQGNASHKEGDGIFSHTYPERMWPKYGGEVGRLFAPDPEEWARYTRNNTNLNHNAGLRYRLGDLDDLVEQLKDNPETRQAYLPIWFPEDTGAVDGQRVPCTLGYHFLIRDGKINCSYYIRSCDFIRHFRDDVYMAARLMQWIADKLPGVKPGDLNMYIASFHVFEGDVSKLKAM